MRAIKRTAAAFVVVLGSLGGNAMAAPENLYFSFDSILAYSPGDFDGRGHAFTIAFPVNEDLTTGIYQESLTLTDDMAGMSSDTDITALNLEYNALNNSFGTDTLAGNLGVNVGHFSAPAGLGAGPESEMMFDIYTKIGLVFAGDSGINLKLGYRALDAEQEDLSDVFLNLGFTLGF